MAWQACNMRMPVCHAANDLPSVVPPLLKRMLPLLLPFLPGTPIFSADGCWP